MRGLAYMNLTATNALKTVLGRGFRRIGALPEACKIQSCIPGNGAGTDGGKHAGKTGLTRFMSDSAYENSAR